MTDSKPTYFAWNNDYALKTHQPTNLVKSFKQVSFATGGFFVLLSRALLKAFGKVEESRVEEWEERKVCDSKA